VNASTALAMTLDTARARLAADPSDPAPRYEIAAALLAAGDTAGGEAMLDEARLLHAIAVMRGAGADVMRVRDDPDYAVLVAGQLYNQRHVATAGVAYGMAIAKDHVSQGALLSFGLSLQHQGRPEEAIRLFAAAAELYPTAAVAQFQLYPHFMVEGGVERHAAAARRWAAMYAPPRQTAPLANDRDPDRKLRIGYVGPTFSSGQVRQFMAPLLDHHDREGFEVFVYPNQAEPAIWARSVHVRPLAGLNDAAACAAIRGDSIDVLIDIWGHTAGNRMTMFAHRCAPVQATWLNYQQTTGLSAMDYMLCADSVASPEMANQCVETVAPLGIVGAPFRTDVRSRNPAPALANGFCTFGAFINPAKLTDQTVAGWARILAAAPTSRLLLKYGYYEDPVLRAVTTTRFAVHGITASRIVFEGYSTGADYEAAFARVDLALDPSPCPGGTTSLEALSRGVPVLTLRGQDYYARLGVQIVLSVGMDDLVAESWDDYVVKAAALADDPTSLDRLRDRAVAGLEAAPFCDEPAMTRRLEAVYRDLFGRWCA
jgi:predicted O-linked N-acetylglucosamine transferase (SPINDLY family)